MLQLRDQGTLKSGSACGKVKKVKVLPRTGYECPEGGVYE
jgi:hypothetical protein